MLSARCILADVNIWLATVLLRHPHHDAVRAWWLRLVQSGGTVAFCRITQLSFLRLLCNEVVMGEQRRSVEQAMCDYQQILGQEPVVFLHEPDGLDAVLEEYLTPRRSSRNFWTDAYLAAFARGANLALATLDRGFEGFSGLELEVLGR